MTSDSFEPRVTPWQLEESEFYELESYREQIEFLLRYAVLAPSSHNTQPWIFSIVEDGVQVFADYSRRLLVSDPDDRELLMSVGAAITNLRVAAAWFGFETTVMYERRPEQSVPVAFVAVRETCASDQDLRKLFPAIRRRHTNRNLFTAEPLSADAVSAVCDMVDQNPGMLCLLRSQDSNRIADLVAEGDRKLMERPAVREELADWLRPSDSSQRDGICTDSLGISSPFSITNWALRKMNVGDSRGRRDRELITSAAALILVSADDDRVSLIRTGEIVERLLLTVTGHGLQYSFLNQPIEVGDLRRKVQDLALTQLPPQLLLRIGHAKETTRPAPRRPVESVIAR
ncbi:MAG: Acg family FMN-binding oxidoreductase [Thermoanaerobaculia bacterium]